MRQSLGIARFQMGTKHVEERDAGENMVKCLYVPSNRSLLSRSTLSELCEFLVMEYVRFDLDPPTICAEDGGPLANTRCLSY